MANGPDGVLIVGAGPTGLALAAQLAAHGLKPRIIDRAADRVHESRALAIQPRTLEVLANLGVTDQLISTGNPAVRLRMHVRHRVLPVPLFDLGLQDSAYPYLLFLSQAETERLLNEHLATVGVTVERGVDLVDLRCTAETAVARLRHRNGRQEETRLRYVVGCDGAHSSVRHLTGIEFAGSSYPQTFVLADTEADGIEPGAAHVFLSEHGILFLFPLGKPASWRLLAMRPPTDPTPPDAPVSLDEVQSLTDTYTGDSVRLHDPVWMTNFRLHHRAAIQYRSGPVFLAGDAAHIHSPAGAQGMNTGIQDAVNLGWKLAQTLQGRAGPALLDTYEKERKIVAGPGWHLLLCGPPEAWPPEISQLDRRYGRGLLTVHHLAAEKTPGVLHDPHGTAVRRLGLTPRDHALYLVRPDGHIGLRAGGPDRTSLLRYLERWLPPAP